MANGSVSVRKYGEKDQNSMSKQDFMDELLADIASYSRKNNDK